MNIGKRIKEIRIRRGLTEKQLGEKIGKSASAISNYENNFRGLNAEILVKIIKVLDVEPNYLFQDYFDDKRYAFRQEEVDFISDYRSLDLQGQIVINNSLASELGRVRDDLDFATRSCVRSTAISGITMKTMFWELLSVPLTTPPSITALPV